MKWPGRCACLPWINSGEPVIHAAVQCFAPGGDLAFYRGLVESGGGMLSGEAMLAGFIAIQPDNEIGRQLALLANVHEPAHVERYREFEDWFKHTQPIPGAFYLWIVEHLFRVFKNTRYTHCLLPERSVRSSC